MCRNYAKFGYRIVKKYRTKNVRNFIKEFDWVLIDGDLIHLKLESTPHLSSLWHKPQLGLPDNLDPFIPLVIDCITLDDISVDQAGVTLSFNMHPVLSLIINVLEKNS